MLLSFFRLHRSYSESVCTHTASLHSRDLMQPAYIHTSAHLIENEGCLFSADSRSHLPKGLDFVDVQLTSRDAGMAFSMKEPGRSVLSRTSLKIPTPLFVCTLFPAEAVTLAALPLPAAATAFG